MRNEVKLILMGWAAAARCGRIKVR